MGKKHYREVEHDDSETESDRSTDSSQKSVASTTSDDEKHRHHSNRRHDRRGSGHSSRGLDESSKQRRKRQTRVEHRRRRSRNLESPESETDSARGHWSAPEINRAKYDKLYGGHHRHALDHDSGSSADSSDDEKRLYHHRQHARTKRRKAFRGKRRRGGSANAVWFAAIGVLIILLILAGWFFLFGPGRSGNKENEIASGAVGNSDVGSGAASDRLNGDESSSVGSEGGESGSAVDRDGPDTGANTNGQAESPAANPKAQDAALNGTSTTLGKPKGDEPADGTTAVKTDAVILGFWETWGPLPIAQIPWSKFWFVTTPGDVASKGALDFHVPPGASTKEFVKNAKAGGSKALFSIGGWTDSNDFTHLMATSESRKDFVTTIKAAVDLDGWHGVDLDWEYPGKAGATADFDLKNDLPNYLEFFKALRAALGKDKLITTDTSSLPWLDPQSGQPSTDLSDFADLIDWFSVMTYDAFTGRISGPNFPISGECSPKDQTYNYKDAMKAWTDAKVPSKKLLLGLAAYGHSWTVDKFDESGASAGAKSPVFQNGQSKEGMTYAQIAENGASLSLHI
ncbi:chitinase [Microbotryomycetes sp. JL201]|nr:chitinase [Microbotryomycetes sp. JL201]